VTRVHRGVFPLLLRVLEHDQYAFKVNKPGTWFFTVSIAVPATTSSVRPTPATNRPNQRDVVIGQLAKLPKRDGKIEVLLRIDNFIDFPESGGNRESKIQMSVGRSFEVGDLVLFRMAPPDRDLFVTFHGIHENEDLPRT